MESETRLRQQLHAQLEPTAHTKVGLSAVNLALAALIMVAVLISIIETEPEVSIGRGDLFRFADLTLGSLFALEYAMRLWTCVENPRFAGYRFPRLRYAFTPAAMIDLVATLPVLLSFGGGSTLALRLVRVLRMARLAKLGRLSRAWRFVSEAVGSRRYELGLTLGLAASAMLIAATLLYWAEGEAQPEQFGSIPRALWWAVVTLTTVGYGDASPVTPFGKMLAGAVAVVGVGLIALPTGILAAAFSDAIQRHRGHD